LSDILSGRGVHLYALEMTLTEVAWGFALVASRAVASQVGDGGDFAAILVPFFDMANHDDATKLTATKSIRGGGGVPCSVVPRCVCGGVEVVEPHAQNEHVCLVSW
jgi:hypothetical protein